MKILLSEAQKIVIKGIHNARKYGIINTALAAAALFYLEWNGPPLPAYIDDQLPQLPTFRGESSNAQWAEVQPEEGGDGDLELGGRMEQETQEDEGVEEGKGAVTKEHEMARVKEARDGEGLKILALVRIPENDQRFFTEDTRKFYEGMDKRNLESKRPFHRTVLEMAEFQRFTEERGLKGIVDVQGYASWELLR